MSEEKPKPISAEAPDRPRTVEILPSVENGISALASAHAPFVIFDSVPCFGQADGMGSITLTALRPLATASGDVVSDRVITCNLRASLAALQFLRTAIDGVFELAQKQANGVSAPSCMSRTRCNSGAKQTIVVRLARERHGSVTLVIRTSVSRNRSSAPTHA